MKHVKKLASLLLALVMVLAMSITALAANVNNETDHSYHAYQIFSGTQAENSVALGDVKWGSGIKGDEFLAELKNDTRFEVDGINIFSSCTTALEVSAVLGNYTDKSDVANAFANVAANHLTDVYTGIAAEAYSVNLATGYYLLVDSSDPDMVDAMNSALLQVTDDITIEKKYDVPSVDKSVKDTDDEWGEAADWEIGSDVPFQLIGTLPSNYDDYETYTYVFHDTLSDGLQYNKDVNVYVQNGDELVELEAGVYDVEWNEYERSLTITFGDLKKIGAVNSDSKIIVEYTAELLDSAKIGQPGNSNKVYLEYSNNPNQSGDGTTKPSTGETPEDEVLVFTYELNVIKLDGEGNPLANAEFVLLNSDRTKAAKVDENGKFVGWVEIGDGTKLVSNEKGYVVISGLDAGNYYLRETKAPAGYNMLTEDINVIISAELNKEEDTPALETLTITVKADNEDAEETTKDGDLETGIVSTEVVNNAGATLPSTGGMGTTIFYILGAILVIAAGLLLIAKKRMENKN